MMPDNVEEMAKRAAGIYTAEKAPPHAGIYVTVPPPPDEMDRARALVVAALRMTAGVLVELAALGLVAVRRAWIWTRQWKRQ